MAQRPTLRVMSSEAPPHTAQHPTLKRKRLPTFLLIAFICARKRLTGRVAPSFSRTLREGGDFDFIVYAISRIPTFRQVRAKGWGNLLEREQYLVWAFDFVFGFQEFFTPWFA